MLMALTPKLALYVVLATGTYPRVLAEAISKCLL